MQRDYRLLDDEEMAEIKKTYYEPEFKRDKDGKITYIPNPNHASGIVGGSAYRHAIAWALQDIEIELLRSHTRSLRVVRKEPH